jgi:16S rRNA (guanine527-N7)-methyltransferase
VRADTLEGVLEKARDLGFLGPGPVEDHLNHAQGFVAAWDGPPPASALDLGSGGGVPALPLALAWPESRWALVESNGRRARFLVRAVRALALQERLEVCEGRAEALGHEPARRASNQLVTARGFAPPAVAAECAAPFLAVGGHLLISEPPEERKWPAAALAELGMCYEARRGSITSLEQVARCPSRFPRRAPAGSPLF